MTQNNPELNTIDSHHAFQQFHNTGILNILAIDKQGLIVYASRAELTFTGYTVEEYIGQPIEKFYTDKPALERIYNSILHSQELSNVESTLKLKDGSVKYVLFSTCILCIYDLVNIFFYS